MNPIRHNSAMATLFLPLAIIVIVSCGNKQSGNKLEAIKSGIESVIALHEPDDYQPACTLLVLPKNPVPGQPFRIVSTGGSNLKRAKITVSGSPGEVSQTGTELPMWRIDRFSGLSQGSYHAAMVMDGKEVCKLTFEIAPQKPISAQGTIWKTTQGWTAETEILYSAWINALFGSSDEQTSWPALHAVTQNAELNFLHNYLSFGEDNADSKTHVLMEPDCADNPFFLRAYFAWKLGLPFGYHVCDRGYVGKSPSTGQWVTNAAPSSRGNTVQAFNSFIRNIMNGVHSGTARAALDNNNADYYPVALDRSALRPGTVYADPYGHTLILTSWKAQTKNQPGILLSTDAQPDKTIAIKRFWKGNFLFNTNEVVGEPGFKAFRPIAFENGKLRLMKNEEITAEKGFAPFSMQQRKMESEAFYRIMERNINPKPLDAEAALLDLIKALHEQLLVRVKSVETGENYLKAHPGTIVPMPGSANGIFQAGGQWEDFSTPNRDLRLLIAMDAVMDFPGKVAGSPKDYKGTSGSTPDEIMKKLQNILNEKANELSISYIRTDGSTQKLTMAELLQRKEALEMGYNPNDGPEIRWGAPENSAEHNTCKRQAPANQKATMQKVRKWFNQRLHPPT